MVISPTFKYVFKEVLFMAKKMKIAKRKIYFSILKNKINLNFI